MKTKNISIIVVVILIGIVGYTLFSNKKEMNEKAAAVPEEFAIPVQTATVGAKTISNGLVATGEFAGWEEVTLVAESQGSIQYLKVEEGQKIKKGQVIAKVDAVSLSSQLSSAQSAYSKAEKDVARYERLLEVGAVSQSALEDIRIQKENAQANIAQINQQLSFTTVKSPIDGVVNKLMVEETSFVMPGNNIAEIVQIDRLKIIVNVAEDNLSKLREGQEVSIKSDVYPLKTFKGKVSTISVKADASRKFQVTIEVANTEDNLLRAGLFAEVNFDALKTNEQEAMVIPREAIVGSLQNPSVYLVNNDSTVSLQKIKAGAVINGDVIVLSGLQNGQQIVTKGIINLTNDTKVKITNN
ncbi:efflux RND transporter periplasmic adaptor subunit [Cochleicola gelatinilyticus]|uniref:Efflux transporter periplasmic adaptor subunit n=1 Tax=Cochleicola gelatinilyticus TaxID=1763537 RepID=A0A167F190_9FLAO|nr:efflux RND transporter periplasmic adaptor subunit [Cochleicola gelatinilyticus]OAB76086.1 efflux transporter periplasmic adaptor subunit [Cochleicola gelatinilyticus]